jgi:hypothetical protein
MMMDCDETAIIRPGIACFVGIILLMFMGAWMMPDQPVSECSIFDASISECLIFDTSIFDISFDTLTSYFITSIRYAFRILQVITIGFFTLWMIFSIINIFELRIYPEHLNVPRDDNQQYNDTTYFRSVLLLIANIIIASTIVHISLIVEKLLKMDSLMFDSTISEKIFSTEIVTVFKEYAITLSIMILFVMVFAIKKHNIIKHGIFDQHIDQD